MGKRADSKALAGADGVGVAGGSNSRIDNAPELKLVTSSKRQMILDGMLEAVGADGYEHTSVRTVLDRTGVYRQAFYDNFADKDDCYLQAYDAGVERVETLVLTAAAAESNWEGKLRAGLGALLDFLDAEPDIGRALVVEVHAAGPEALAKRTAALARINHFLDQARAVAGNSQSPPPIAGEGIAAGIHAVIHSRLSAGGTDSFRQLLPEFMYFAVLPYFGPESAAAEMKASKAP
ncbi:MAG TPA: TetR/AcrR family transcriptional regulator [Solirubrobacterales bacterium]|nr:TetR/AcrR family transcriptional regulator [Solirubrobacterales bacterium]